MRVSLLFGSALASLALVALASVLFDLSFERAVLLAPVIVLSVGAAAGLLVLWGKAALEPLRARSRRR
ncbi:MAG TPA: hypothetical protein VF895_02540 [Gaiellaceae bacterium]